jgi:hypothetical protein
MPQILPNSGPLFSPLDDLREARFCGLRKCRLAVTLVYSSQPYWHGFRCVHRGADGEVTRSIWSAIAVRTNAERDVEPRAASSFASPPG